MKKSILFLALLIVCSFAIAQKVKDEDISFKYQRLPLNPIDKKITNYASIVHFSYEEEDKRKQEEYAKMRAEADKKFKDDKKAADEQYEKDKQEYNKKSWGEKFANANFLHEDNRPQKEQVSKEKVERPFIRKSFDKVLLANTYIKLEGYDKSESADFNVFFIAHGMEWLEPTINQMTMSVMSGPDKGKAKPSFTMQIQYRSPVELLVETKEGKIIIKEMVEKTNQYKTFKSSGFDSEELLYKNVDPNSAISQFEQKLLEENLKITNQYLNEKCAVSVLEREATLTNVETKKQDYSDFNQAFTLANDAYRILVIDKNEAQKKLKQAIEIWDKAFKESDPKNKNARVNEEISIALVFNLSEAYLWGDDFTNAKTTAAKAAIFDLSKRETKRMDELKLLIADQKQRFEANQNH